MSSSLVRSALVVTLLTLISWVFAVPARATEKSAEPGMPPAAEMQQSMDETQFSLDTAPASGRRDAANSMESDTGSERPMGVTDGEEGISSFESIGQSFDADVLDHIRMEDEISSLSF